MDAQVTEEMVQAAHRMLPGISNRVRIRQALEAALAHAPHADIDVPVTAHIHLQIDREQLHRDTITALEQVRAGYRSDPTGRLVLASFNAALPADEPHVTPDGLQGPGVTEPTGQTAVTMNEPRVLAGITEIAAHLQAGRSTVASWVKNAPSNGMPAPIAVLAAGPVYDLEAVKAWHRKRKGNA